MPTQSEVWNALLTLHQDNYFFDADKTVYRYGLSKLDIRYDKFLESGKIMLRYDAPVGETISSVTDVVPQIWNISAAQLDDVFSYRVIWETSWDSGIYTLSPVPLSKKIWLEVSLNKSLLKGTPALSGLTITYS